MSEVLEKISALAERIAEKKRGAETQPDPIESFRGNFREFREKVLEPAVDKVNQKLNTSGSVVNVLTSDLEQSRFFSAQLVFHDAGKDPNAQSDPYVLVLGHPSLGEVRVVQGRSDQPGENLNIVDLNDQRSSEQEEVVIGQLSSLIEGSL